MLRVRLRARYLSDLDSFPTPQPQVFYTYCLNHARRLRHEKLPYPELPRSLSGYFKRLLDPGGRFASETAVRRFQKRNGRYVGCYVTVSEAKRLLYSLKL